MRRLSLICAGLGLLGLTALTNAATYSGNGNSGFGGPIGLGSLSVTDNGTVLSGTLNKGPNGMNDVLVIYVDSTAGGFADTSGFADSGDGLRKSISGFDGGTNRSVLTFPAGFSPDYAIALGPQSSSFGGLWQLANGGANSLNFVSSVNLSPTGTNSSPTYTFNLNLSQIASGPNSSIKLLGTYTAESGFRSDEFVAGNGTGAQGWNPFTGTQAVTYVTVPEPSALSLAAIAAIGLLRRRRRAM